MDTVRPLLFLDAGGRRLKDAPPGQTGTESLAALGAGLRWQWRTRLDANVDLAHVVSGLSGGGTASGDNRLHLGLLYRF